MSEPRWTPGPWVAIARDSRHLGFSVDQWIETQDGEALAEVLLNSTPFSVVPNANLIAAAPDLYEALRPLAEVRLRPETVEEIEEAVIMATGNGELATHLCNLLTGGADEARRVSAKARGEAST